mmetsp:Transcript_10321/g.18245  ORF Transcript_10321/g.18245 Transcript_10321/m.18245 type:complete len:113 (+) Transcript_10321:150-488(+)
MFEVVRGWMKLHLEGTQHFKVITKGGLQNLARFSKPTIFLQFQIQPIAAKGKHGMGEMLSGVMLKNVNRRILDEAKTALGLLVYLWLHFQSEDEKICNNHMCSHETIMNIIN